MQNSGFQNNFKINTGIKISFIGFVSLDVINHFLSRMFNLKNYVIKLFLVMKMTAHLRIVKKVHLQTVKQALAGQYGTESRNNHANSLI